MLQLLLAMIIFASLACTTETVVSDRTDLSENNKPENITAEVKLILSNFHDSIQTWSIEYQVSGESAPYYLHLKLAGQYPDLCSSFNAKSIESNPDWKPGVVGMNWHNKLLNRNVLVTSSRCQWIIPGLRNYGEFPLTRDKPLPRAIDTEILSVILMWWPFEMRPAPKLPGGTPRVIPEIVKSENYIVSSMPILFKGRRCYILENPGHDKIWLDIEKNCAIVKRELYDSILRRSIQRFEYSDHFEFMPGNWVARKIRRISLTQAEEDKSGKKEVSQDLLYTILDVKVNEAVSSDNFKMKQFPPGTVKINVDKTYEQIVPGGVDLLDNIILWIHESKRLKKVDFTSRPLYMHFLYVVIGALLFVLLQTVNKIRRLPKIRNCEITKNLSRES